MGHATWIDAVITSESSSNSTEYSFPTPNVTGNDRFLNFSISTTTVTLSGLSITHTDTTKTFTQSQSSNSSSTSCPTVV